MKNYPIEYHQQYPINWTRINKNNSHKPNNKQQPCPPNSFHIDHQCSLKLLYNVLVLVNKCLNPDANIPIIMKTMFNITNGINVTNINVRLIQAVLI